MSNVHEASCLTNEHRALVDEFRARFSHISHTVAPVVCHIGAGGTGKTDDALRDPTRLRCIYIAPYNRLIRAKAAEYKRDLTGAEVLERLETRVVGLQKGDRKSLVPMADQSINVTLSTRALHANIEIYHRIAHLTNTLVCDEVQLWGREACLLMLERYPHHEIIFAGDPGRQLGVISNDTCKSSEFDLHETYPVIRFDRIFRVKCDRLMAIRIEGRRMLDAGADINAIRTFYMHHFPVLRTHKDVAAAYQAFARVDGHYEPKDMLICRQCSTNELRREWTEYLTPLQPFDENGVALQKYTIKSTSLIHSVGDIVISAGEPADIRSELSHGSTAHSAIGITARGKVLIDVRRTWDKTHFETMVGRAQYYEDIMLIDIAESVSEKYKNTSFYLLESEAADMTYVGHTTQPLDLYIANKRKDQKCMSRVLFAHGDLQVRLLETRPCSGLDEAEAYELHLMSQYPNCVNKNLLSQRVAKSPYTREYIDKANYYALVEHLRLHEPSSDRMKMFADAVGRMKVQEEGHDRLFIGTRYHQAPFGGRYYAVEGSSLWDKQKPGKTTIQSMWCQLRQWLLGDFHDIDIVNCIPSIMQQVFVMHELDPASHSTLTQYIDTRASVLAEISNYYKCTKGQAKTLVIRLYNGGAVSGWLQECNLNTNTPDSRFVCDFRAQLTPLIDLINSKPMYAQIKNHCSENKNEYNVRVSTFANILFYHEAIILVDAIVASIKRQGLSVNSLIFDGTPVAAPPDTDMLAVIQRAEADVLANTGFAIKLLEKPMYGMNKLPLEALMYAVENHSDLGPIPDGCKYIARPIELPEIQPPAPIDVDDNVVTMEAITP